MPLGISDVTLISVPPMGICSFSFAICYSDIISHIYLLAPPPSGV